MANLDPQALDALAFLYLTFGHSTDGTLTGDEMRALAEKLRDWSPDTGLGDVGELLKRTVAEYKALSVDARHARAESCAERIATSTDAVQRVQVMADLRTIAAADGNVSAEEQAFMAGLADRFGL
jgi:tellurite resistance protein